jgi:type IV pilus assembly protein PilM
MSDSMWKKEISFGRKKAPAEDVPEAPVEEAAVEATPVAQPKQSMLKKEISFGRKKAPVEAAVPVAAVEAEAKPKQSMLKKEISFGRKKAPVEAAVPVAAVEAEAEPKQSMLKKEISFRRKKAPVEAPLQVAAVEAETQPKQSLLKKEISFSRKKRDKELDQLVQDAGEAFSPSFGQVPPPSEVTPTAVAEAAVAAMPDADAEPAFAAPSAALYAVEPSLVEADLPPVPPPLVVEPAVQSAPFEVAPPAPVSYEPAQVEPAPVSFEPETPAPVSFEPDLFDPVSVEPAPVAPFALEPAATEPIAPVEPFSLEPAAAEPAQAEPAPVEPFAFEPIAPEPAPVAPLSFEPVAPEPVALEPEPVEPIAPEPAPAEPAPLAPVSFEPTPVASDPVSAVPELPLDLVAGAEPVAPPASPDPVSFSALSPEIVAASADVSTTPSADVLAFPEQSAAPEEPPAEPERRAPLPPIQLVTPEPELPTYQVEEPPPAEAELPPLQPELPPFDPAVPLTAEPLPVDPWLASPELPPAPETAVPVAVHPPVPASELPPIVEAKVPFWKKDVSFSRKAKAQRKADADAFDDPPVTNGPWWKKQLSLSRTPKSGAEPEIAAAAAVETAPAPAVKTPWWKKELGGKKKTASAAPLAVVGAAETASAPSASFLKRGLSMPTLPTLSLPSLRGSKGGGRKGVKGTIVGLKVGASQIAAARVSNNGVATLEQVARQALPMGIVVGGELRDPDALTDALKAFFAKNKLPKKGVRLGIANNRIGVRMFDISGVEEEKQLANAIHFRAQEALPIPLDEAVLDYHIVDESVDAEGKSIKRVLLVVAYKELIDRYVGACRNAGITLAGIDLEAFALLRSLAAPTDGGTAALVAVSIGYDRSTFAVSDGRVCEFTRVLEWGGWTLNIALARAFDTAPSEVEALKCSLSLDGTTVPEGITEEQTATAVEAVRRQVQTFARELVSSLQFYQNQPGSLGIGEIVITGGTAELPGLAAELERLIGVKVRVGDPFARMKVTKKVASSMDRHHGSLSVAIGLGIED